MAQHGSDYLVLGAGVAGLSFALEAAATGSVTVLCKGPAQLTNTAWAQGGIAAVWDEADSVDAHVVDTIVAGAELAEPSVVRDILADGPGAVRRLVDWGAVFSAGEGGGYDLTREGGHGARRILHAADMTGAEIQRALLAAVAANPRIRLVHGHVAIDLVTERKVARHVAKRRLGLHGPEVEAIYGPGGPEGWMPDQPDRCIGVYALDEATGRVSIFRAPVTLLATGGAGKLYRFTTNPDPATGDGMAMAWRAGAVLANMEFIQFHPTCLYSSRVRNFLVSEALRGEGGILRLPDGTPFMDAVHPMGSLAPRDIVAREIDKQIKRLGLECVFLDLTHEPGDFLRERFPGIDARLREAGIDMTREPIPVVPAAHYFCGGVLTDTVGRTRIAGLYAAGEVACTGLHGANRLASNSLLEGIVVGRRAAAAAAAAGLADAGVEVPAWDSGSARDADELVVVAHLWDEIRRLMGNYVGIVRTDRRLHRALSRVQLVQQEIQTFYWNFKLNRNLVELRNLALVAEIVIRSALGRRESRGLHYTLDCPERDDTNWRRPSLLRRAW